MGIDAGIVFLPRFTTLVGATTFATAPLDVSQQGGAQFQVWRSDVRVSSGSGTFNLHMEESLDAESWVLGPSSAGVSTPFTILAYTTTLLSYDFRLRWFRIKVVLAGTNPMVSCWAEGLLRGGGGGGSPMGDVHRQAAGEADTARGPRFVTLPDGRRIYDNPDPGARDKGQSPVNLQDSPIRILTQEEIRKQQLDWQVDL